MRLGLCVFAVVLCLALPCFGNIYSGTLSSADGTILGTGNWLSGSIPTTLQYSVYQNPDQTWHYGYLFSSPPGDLSHLDVGISTNITSADIFNVSGGSLSIGLWEPGPSNPNMPGSLFGAKFDVEGDNPFAMSLDSTKQPMWVDFYAKDGRAGGSGFNACWNSGFLAQNPQLPYWATGVSDHILAPDTVVVPVPSALLLGLIGVSCVGLKLRRFA